MFAVLKSPTIHTHNFSYNEPTPSIQHVHPFFWNLLRMFFGLKPPTRKVSGSEFSHAWMDPMVNAWIVLERDSTQILDSLRWPWWHTVVSFKFCLQPQNETSPRVADCFKANSFSKVLVVSFCGGPDVNCPECTNESGNPFFLTNSNVDFRGVCLHHFWKLRHLGFRTTHHVHPCEPQKTTCSVAFKIGRLWERTRTAMGLYMYVHKKRISFPGVSC